MQREQSAFNSKPYNRLAQHKDGGASGNLLQGRMH